MLGAGTENKEHQKREHLFEKRKKTAFQNFCSRSNLESCRFQPGVHRFSEHLDWAQPAALVEEAGGSAGPKARPRDQDRPTGEGPSGSDPPSQVAAAKQATVIGGAVHAGLRAAGRRPAAPFTAMQRTTVCLTFPNPCRLILKSVSSGEGVAKASVSGLATPDNRIIKKQPRYDNTF